MAMIDNKNGKPNKPNFFANVVNELKKVTYPTMKVVRKNTSIVIMLSIVVGIFIGCLDYVFGKGAAYLITTNTAETTTNDDSTSTIELPDEDDYIETEEMPDELVESELSTGEVIDDVLGEGEILEEPVDTTEEAE